MHVGFLLCRYSDFKETGCSQGLEMAAALVSLQKGLGISSA